MRKPKEFVAHPISFTKAQSLGTKRAVVTRMVDGDTYYLFVDSGFGGYDFVDIRLHGANAPEIFHPKDADEKARGEAAKKRASQLLGFYEGATPLPDFIGGQHVLIRSYKDHESFGRYVADIWFPERVAHIERGTVVLKATGKWRSLASVLVAEGHAVPFDGVPAEDLVIG